jgi:pimeloyl-ACP methyl ester carboxylesterase
MLDTVIHRWLKVPYALHADVLASELKSVATVLFIHGIGNKGRAWDEVIAKLPKNIKVVTVDLLGFGQSPSPSWAIYNARTQARSVLTTFLKLRLRGPIIIVGHSLGALVAVDVARRYPLIVRSLILCSPPFYQLHEDEKRLLPRVDYVLTNIYRTVKKYPKKFLQIAAIAMRYKLINNDFSVTNENIDSYMETLGATIINQTSFADVMKLKLPINILHGTLDPVVVARNLKELARDNPNIKLKSVLAGHEIKGRMVDETVKAISQASH